MWWKGVWGVMAVWVELGIIRSFTFHHFLQCYNGANIPLTKYNDAHAPIESRGWSIFREEDTPGGAPLKLMGYQVRRRVVISRMSGGAPLILGILGWHGRDIGAGAAGCLWYPAGTNRGRKQGAKAHFSLSRFGDYPISLTLTSLTGPGEFNTIPFRRIEKNKTTSSIDWVVTFLQRLQHPVKASMVVKLSDKWFSDFFFRLKAPPIYITLCYCKHHAIRMMHCVTSFCNKLLVCVTNGM